MTIHRNYADMTISERETVDEAFNACLAKLQECLPARKFNMADPAERLVEAIATYVMEADTPRTIVERNIQRGRAA